MAEIEIHGKKVKYDKDSQSVKYAVEYLQGLEKEEVRSYFHTAVSDKYARFETPRHLEDRHLEHDMTLEYHSGDDYYYLRKRTQH